jgi:FkbM family methyltransferase
MNKWSARLETVRTPWRLRYALRRRAMLTALRLAVPLTERPKLARLGSQYGGWTIPADLPRADWTCLCAGAGIDVSFDLELARRFGARVITIDPTDEARANATQYAELEFVQAALWSADGELELFVAADPDHRTLSSDDLQDTGRSVRVQARGLASLPAAELVKLDIEGAEYEVLPHVGPATRVLCVELHPTRGIAATVRATRRLTRDGFRLVARHGSDFTFVRD